MNVILSISEESGEAEPFIVIARSPATKQSALKTFPSTEAPSCTQCGDRTTAACGMVPSDRTAGWFLTSILYPLTYPQSSLLS